MKKKSCLCEVSEMYSEPLLPAEDILPQQECCVADVSSLSCSPGAQKH